MRAGENFLHHLKGKVQLFIEHLHVHREYTLKFLWIFQADIGADGKIHSSAVQINLACKILVGMPICIHVAQHCLQKSRIGQILRTQHLCSKKHLQISDTGCKKLRMDYRYPVLILYLILRHFPLDRYIFPGEHGDFLQILRRGGFLLVSLQLPCGPDQIFPFLGSETVPVSGKLFRQSLFLMGCEIHLRADNHNRLVGIVQKPLPDQVLKIIPLGGLLQKIKGFLVFQVHKGIPVIKPAVHAPQAVDQPLRRGAVIRLPVAELIIV